MSLTINIIYKCISNNSELDFFYFCYFYYNQLMHNHLIKVYITIVFCVYSYMFQHFRVIIRELQPMPCSVSQVLLIAIVDNTVIKL